MIDPNFTHIKYSNFPEHYLREVYDMSKDCLPEGILGVEFENIDEEMVLVIQNNKFKNASITIENIHFGLNVYISQPAKKMFDVHIDRSRNIGINFPIQLDPNDGCLLVMKDDNYDALGNPIEEPSNIKFGDVSIPKNTPGHRKWPDAKEENMERVLFDKPVMLNTKRPHSYVNYTNKFRIIASLNTKLSAKEVHENLKGFL